MINILKKDFLRNVFVLMGGTTIAQIINFGLTPILTRVYSPFDFGIYGLFTVMTTILGIIPLLQLFNVIIIEHDDNYVRKASGTMLIISTLISSLLLLIFALFNFKIAELMHIEVNSKLLLLVPFLVWINSINIIFMSWANREKKFKLMATNRVMLALFTPFLSILFSYIFNNAVGLILAYAISLIMTTILLTNHFILKEKLKFVFVFGNIKTLIKEQSEFPVYSLPSGLINALIGQIPIVMLGKFVDIKSIGQFNLSNRVLGMPITIISSAFNEVFRQKASKDYNEKGNCEGIFIKSFLTLFIVSTFAFSLFIFFGSNIFTFVFGEEWAEAGKFSAYMVPLFVFRFSVSPLTYTFIIAKKQKVDFIGHLVMLTLIFLSFPISYSINPSPISLIVGYTISYCLIYIFYLYLSYIYSKGEKL